MSRLKLSTALFLFLLMSQIAFGTFLISFENKEIKVTSITQNLIEVKNELILEGNATIPIVFVAVRGPKGEMYSHSTTVVNNKYSVSIPLKYGEGVYTIWLGNSPTRFDGSIRFQVKNVNKVSTSYLVASQWVDVENQIIKTLALEITKGKATDLEKSKAIYNWIINNISYDYNLFKSGENVLTTASATAISKTGICRDYAFLFAALSRASGIETKIIYGDYKSHGLHAWNEIFIDGKWLQVDSTFGAGVISNNSFIKKPSLAFFNFNSTDYLNQVATTH